MTARRCETANAQHVYVSEGRRIPGRGCGNDTDRRRERMASVKCVPLVLDLHYKRQQQQPNAQQSHTERQTMKDHNGKREKHNVC